MTQQLKKVQIWKRV